LKIAPMAPFGKLAGSLSVFLILFGYLLKK